MSDRSEITQEIKDIYSKLSDEESRDLFNHRLLYCLSGEEQHLYNMLSSVNARLRKEYADSDPNLLSNFPHSAEGPKLDVVMFGAGGTANSCEHFAEFFNFNVLCFCDNDKGKQGKEFLGYKIISPEQLAESYKDEVVVIPNYFYVDEMYSQLIDLGFSADKIFCINRNYSYHKQQYFGEDFLNFSADEVFVDAGCFNFESSQQFIDRCPDYKKIYAIEPDPECYNNCLDNIRSIGAESVELVNKGAWSCEETLSFFCTENHACSSINSGGEISIETIIIDKMVGDDSVSFIKMDIEGAELEALRGAEKTIIKNKPKLAICIYHKPEDVLDIPLYLSEIVPEYKFYIRHYSYAFAETVLYAIIDKQG